MRSTITAMADLSRPGAAGAPAGRVGFGSVAGNLTQAGGWPLGRLRRASG